MSPSIKACTSEGEQEVWCGGDPYSSLVVREHSPKRWETQVQIPGPQQAGRRFESGSPTSWVSFLTTGLKVMGQGGTSASLVFLEKVLTCFKYLTPGDGSSL